MKFKFVQTPGRNKSLHCVISHLAKFSCLSLNRHCRSQFRCLQRFMNTKQKCVCYFRTFKVLDFLFLTDFFLEFLKDILLDFFTFPNFFDFPDFLWISPGFFPHI